MVTPNFRNLLTSKPHVVPNIYCSELWRCALHVYETECLSSLSHEHRWLKISFAPCKLYIYLIHVPYSCSRSFPSIALQISTMYNFICDQHACIKKWWLFLYGCETFNLIVVLIFLCVKFVRGLFHEF